MNHPADIQILHAVLCRNYTKFRAAGGRADSPYVPFFLDFLAGRNEVNVSPTAVIFRDDGTRGSIDLVELFTEMGYL